MIIKLNESVTASFDDSKENEISVFDGLVKLDRSNLILMASRPGMGKTSLALYTALEYMKKSNKTVYIFSSEILAEHVYQRLIRTLAEVDYQTVQNGMLSEDQKDAVLRASEYLKTLNIIIDDDNKSEIESRLDKVDNVGLVIVDYLELAVYKNVRDGYKALKDIKFLAKEKDIPIIVTSQLSCKLERRKDKRPKLEDVSERCVELIEYSDTVIFVYRDEYYDIRFEKECENAEIIITKNRYGSLKTLELEWLGEYCKFGS